MHSTLKAEDSRTRRRSCVANFNLCQNQDIKDQTFITGERGSFTKEMKT